MQEIPDLGNVFSMEQTPSIPTFGLRELDSISLSSQLLCLGVYVLFWMVGQRTCSVSLVDDCRLLSILGDVFCTAAMGALLLSQSGAAFCPCCWHRSLGDAGC